MFAIISGYRETDKLILFSAVLKTSLWEATNRPLRLTLVCKVVHCLKSAREK